MTSLRQRVAELMAATHCITRELATQHVAAMSAAEVKQRFRRYVGMESSVVRRNQQSESDFYQVFGFATATARRTALNPVPELPTEQQSGKQSAIAGSKKPGPMVDRALSASH
jgi:hypothetical protein